VKLSPFAFDRDRELLRFIFPIAVLIVYGQLWRRYIGHLFLVGTVDDSHGGGALVQIAGREAMARLGVAGALVVLLTVAAAAVAYSLVLIAKHRKDDDKSGTWMVWSAVGLTIALVVFVSSGLDTGGLIGNDVLYRQLDEPVFLATVGRIGDGEGISLLRLAVATANLAGVGAGLFVLMANCRIGSTFRPLPSPPAGAQDGAARLAAAANEEAPLLAQAMADHRALLFLGAALLIVGVFVAKAWRDWPLAFCAASPCAPDSALAVFGQKATASVLFDATSFVMILVAIFVPKGIMLRSRADDLAAAAGMRPGTREFTQWQDAAGLTYNWQDQLVRLIALLSPLLGTVAAGALQQIVSFLH
jgi:hypothetical protein